LLTRSGVSLLEFIFSEVTVTVSPPTFPVSGEAPLSSPLLAPMTDPQFKEAVGDANA
jgi:hypothetical protein